MTKFASNTQSRQGKHKRRQGNKRKRKTSSQIQLLEAEFANKPDWDKEDITRIAELTGLAEGQVYKWGWDQKQKLQFSIYTKLKLAPSLSQLFNDELPKVPALAEVLDEVFSNETHPQSEEVLFPLQIDRNIMQIQRLYRDCVELY